MTRRSLILAGGAAALAVGWYLFRPERLFINQTVSSVPRGGC